MATFTQVPGELNIEISIRDGLALALNFTSGTFNSGYTYSAAVIKAEVETETTIVVSGTGSYYDQLTLYLPNSDILALEANKHTWYLVCTDGATSLPREYVAGYFEIKPYPYP